MEKPRKRKDGEKETERVAVILQDGMRRFLIRKRVFRKQAAATTIATGDREEIPGEKEVQNVETSNCYYSSSCQECFLASLLSS